MQSSEVDDIVKSEIIINENYEIGQMDKVSSFRLSYIK